MHEVDETTEQMVRSVLAYAENRLRMNPVPLDKGFLPAEELYERLDGLIRETPRQPDEVLGVYTSVIAPSVLSADSPRFLGFIPAAPTKASLLFDMLVSCASIQGISWLEASGAIAAENSVNTPRLLEMDALVVETPDHRLTADTVRDSVPQDTPNIAAVVCTSGTTNAGIIDDLAGVGAIARDRGWWFHVDGAHGGSGIFARSLRSKYDGLEQADSFVLDPHKWLFTPFDCCALGPAVAPRPDRVHPADQVGRRNRRPVRIPASQHRTGPDTRDPGPHRVMTDPRENRRPQWAAVRT